MNTIVLNTRILLLSISIPLITATGLYSCSTQAHEPEDQNTRTHIPTILITSGRTEQAVQETPITVSVIRGETLEDAHIESSVDIQQRTSSLVFKTNTVLGSPYLRGVGSDTISSITESPIALYIDEIYQPRAAASVIELYDVDQIEIIKGPQGTLYGRNATGGAIKIAHKEPESTAFAKIDLQTGNYNKKRAEGVINQPLNPKTKVRFSAVKSKRDGYMNVVGQNFELDDQNLTAWRAQANVDFNKDIHALYRVDNSKHHDAQGLSAKVNSRFPSPAIHLFGAHSPSDPRRTSSNREGKTRVELQNVSQRLHWHHADFSLTSLTAYRKSDGDVTIDLDGTHLDYSFNDDSSEKSESYTQEFQFTGQYNALSWLAGLYYFKEKAEQHIAVRFPLAARSLITDTDNETDAYALFTEGRYPLSDSLALTLGARYSREKKIGTITTGPPSAPATFLGDKSWTNVSPKLSLSYQKSVNTLFYGNISRGFKSGGFDTSTNGNAFDQEMLTNYELGVKNFLAQRRLSLYFSAFYYDYEDMQVQRRLSEGPTGVVIDNAAEASIKGLEVEIDARISSALRLEMIYARLNATYNDYVTIDTNSDTPTTAINLKGNALPQAPKQSLFTALSYRLDLADKGFFTLKGEWKYQSKIYFDQFNAAASKQDSYHLYNASISYSPYSKQWSVSLWGKNLSNKLYRQNVIRSQVAFGVVDLWAPPRTFGIAVEYRFDH